MKLNNHGWGYRDMIIYSCLILLVLLVTAYNINYLYSGIKTNDKTTNSVQQPAESKPEYNEPQEVVVDNNYYYNLEIKIKNATLDYLNDYSYELTNQILNTSLETLVDLGYMSAVYDQTGKYACNGYSNSYVTENGQYIIKPYLNCNNYITEGY